tara:strand:- start:144 stop:479 length:336 start_codon:yes stop_codon:yes gene_type:complete
MEDYQFKNLAGAAMQERWKELADDGSWDSILQLTTERLNHVYEEFQEKGITDLKKEDALTRIYVANTICACHSLLRLIQTLDNDIYKDLIEINADERIKRLEERIKKLEGK